MGGKDPKALEAIRTVLTRFGKAGELDPLTEAQMREAALEVLQTKGYAPREAMRAIHGILSDLKHGARS